jgi:hypothetical protein
MTRSRNIAAVGGFAVTVTLASLLAGCPSGGVGDPCIPEDEYKELFAGFKITEDNIESRSFQCQTRICLVNHFQGRVTCPTGQGAPALCDPRAPSCPVGEDCLASALGGSLTGGACATDEDCGTTADPGDTDTGYYCENGDCRLYVCSQPGDEDGVPPHHCFIPGTDTPVAYEVCGQCSNRPPDKAVYCSCRCGVAEGEEEDEDFNFCECPEGYACAEIRKNIGLGDPLLTGKYCIKEGTQYQSENDCGAVSGNYNPSFCKGQGG